MSIGEDLQAKYTYICSHAEGFYIASLKALGHISSIASIFGECYAPTEAFFGRGASN